MTEESLDRILVLIPTYNDFELLAEIISSLSGQDSSCRILVVDDGSTEKVDVLSLDSGVLYFRLPANFGIGMATHVAFDHVIRHNYQAMVRLDADGQHPIEMVPQLLEPIASREADLVVGVRTNRHQGEGLRSFVAALVRRYLTLVSKLMTGGRAPSDTNSGFFAISKHAVEMLNTALLERYPEPQMYVLAGRQGLKIKEIPIEQQARLHGSSTVTFGRAMALLYRFNVFVLGELLHRSRMP